MAYDYHWFRDEFTEEELQEIHEAAKEGDRTTGMTGPGNYDMDQRNSLVTWILNNDKLNRRFYEIIRRANRVAYDFHIEDIFKDSLQYSEYHADYLGHFDWHVDTLRGVDGQDAFYERKLTCVLQLSDSDEYEGGDLWLNLHGKPVRIDDFRQKGMVIVFPTFLPHKVEDVTKGVRRTLVAWAGGRHFT